MNNIELIKQQVKQHQITPFKVGDISCNNDTITILDKYSISNSKMVQKLFDKMGIRSNLTKEIFINPQDHWNIVRNALNTIDNKKRFSCITTNNYVATFSDAVVEVETQLNFDNRIDNLLNAIEETNFKLADKNDITFDHVNCEVNINTVSTESVNCGQGDDWQFGTNVGVSHSNQQFTNYFLRLICTNGMTTRENLMYRLGSAKDSIGKQYKKFISKNEFVKSIKPRVHALKTARASLYEVNSIANCLKKEEREVFMPQYNDIVQDFENAGHDIGEFNSKRQRLTYTDENLYDVFNLATNLSSHHRDTLDVNTCMSLNKAAAEMFVKGPNLTFNLLDIYNRG